MNIIMRNELKNADDPVAKQAELVADYEQKFQNPYKAAELGYIDEVLPPEELRPRLCQAIRLLQNKRDANPPKKHGNMPL